MTLQADALFNIIHSTMGDRKVPRTEEAGAALHVLGTLHWSYNAQKLFCIILFPEIWVCSFLARFITRELASAWRFKMIKNGSCLARNWRMRVGIELNATIGQLVKTWMPIGCGTTNISDKKGTRTTGCWQIWCPHERIRTKMNICCCFSEGEHSDIIMNIAAQCSARGCSKLWPKHSGWELWMCAHSTWLLSLEYKGMSNVRVTSA